MQRIQKIALLGCGAILLWTALAMGGQRNGGIGGKIGSGSGREWVQFTGRIFQAGETLKEKCSVSGPHLYRLNHRLGQVVIGIPPEAAAPPYHCSVVERRGSTV